jgi:DNA repair exonuclease SbcCD nuclease subunit
MFSFLHAADIHLDSPLRGLEVYPDAPVDQIRCAARRSFDNFVDLAIEEAVAFVLLAGDLYDGDWKDYNTGIYFVNRMGRLREAGINVFMVSGNHDAASQITRSLNLPDNVTLFSHKKAETVILEEFGAAIHGMSFATRAVSEDLTRHYPGAYPGFFNIGLLHTSLNGRAGHEPYAPCTLDNLKSKGYQYWALGHVHQREEVARDPWVIFPGNLQGRHIRETGAKGCTLVSVEDGRAAMVGTRETDVLRWALCRVDVSRCDRIESVFEMFRAAIEDERLHASGRPLAVRLVIEGETPLHAKLHEGSAVWAEEFRSIAAGFSDAWLEKVLIHTKREPQRRTSIPNDSPVAALIQSVERVQIDASRLLDLVPEFGQLHSRLPADILGDGDPFHYGEEEFSALREDVKELLMAKLQQGEHHEN